MRKTIKNSEAELAPEKPSWLDLRAIARVEVTSEDWRYPIESAFDEEDQRGWRAADRGKQTISLFFDEPQRIRRICLRFIELEAERTQQIEDYEVDLDGVRMLQLIIDPDISRGPTVASLASSRLA